MECPVCGQINKDDATTCLSCGRALPPYMGGASIDTTRTDDESPMVVAGNIDFPVPPSKESASSISKPSVPQSIDAPLSTRFPKPSLPKLSIPPSSESVDVPVTPQSFDDEDPTLIEPPLLDSSLDLPPQVTQAGRPAHLIYAGFWYRFLAMFIDNLLIGTVLGVLWFFFVMALAFSTFGGGGKVAAEPSAAMVGVSLVIGLIYFIAPLLYFSLCESSRWQATLGKMAIGLKVTDTHGNRLSFLRALGRYVAHFVSNVTLYIGFLVNVFTPRQQALHDLIAGTLVVYKEVTPNDLELHPSAPASSTQKTTALVAWGLMMLFLVSFIALFAWVGMQLPKLGEAQGSKRPVSTVAARMHEAEMLGAEATAAATSYQENHDGQLPPSLAAADFHQTSPQVRRLWIDSETGIIHVELGFAPLRKKTLDFVPEFDESGDLIWRCRSSDIDPQYLPEHCQ
ncbi:MAG: RDD family protein [Betaproteobacteria bacterium]|nr:RDD family protein [Betaproteobacteria bacterium]